MSGKVQRAPPREFERHRSGIQSIEAPIQSVRTRETALVQCRVLGFVMERGERETSTSGENKLLNNSCVYIVFMCVTGVASCVTGAAVCQ